MKTIVFRDEAAENPKDLKETVNRILLCYKYFRVQLEHQPLEKVQKLWNTLIKDDVKFLVNIDLLVEENEQAIFDAVNSSGVRLTCSDTIKNAVFQRYIVILKGETSIAKAEQLAIKLYEKNWVSAFLANSEDAQYWATQHQAGRLLRDNIEILLHCVAVIEGFFDPASMKMSERLSTIRTIFQKCLPKNCRHLSSGSMIMRSCTERRSLPTKSVLHDHPRDS